MPATPHRRARSWPRSPPSSNSAPIRDAAIEDPGRRARRGSYQRRRLYLPRGRRLTDALVRRDADGRPLGRRRPAPRGPGPRRRRGDRHRRRGAVLDGAHRRRNRRHRAGVALSTLDNHAKFRNSSNRARRRWLPPTPGRSSPRRGSCPVFMRFVRSRRTCSDVIAFEELIAADGDPDDWRPSLDDVAFIQYTSDPPRVPKGWSSRTAAWPRTSTASTAHPGST